jgi:hypothetical protein
VGICVYYSLQRPDIHIPRPMEKFHVLDNFCILIFYIGYTVVQLNLAGYVDVFPQMFCDAVLFLCPHGPSCVMGDVESTSFSCFSCSRSLRVHSVEGVSKRLRLLYVVFSVSVNGSDKTVHGGESFRFLGMGHTWSFASIPPFFPFVGKCL